MRLKRIKLAGFKSFVDPTSIPFPDDMTAIVGPNGCGKSNVIDAVRWVLGESSAKNLRGDAMTDVIFNGSSARKPVSQSSVELVFDNSAGRIQGEYAGYNELSVKRIVTRDAQSTYLLNGSKCRRRDVTDLFLGTGLGPRSYAIIEQGMISRLIESKPQELRVFIEEAAGISKYKERRRETENRIRHTRENLERLEDVRGELGQQLEKLQRQASAAKRYKELKAQERVLKAQLAVIKLTACNDKINQLDKQIARQETDLEGLIAQQRKDETLLHQERVKQQELQQQLSDVQQKLFTIGTQISRLEQSKLHTRQRTSQITQEQTQLRQEIDELRQQNAEEQLQQEQLEQQVAIAEPELAVLEEAAEQAKEKLAEEENTRLEKEQHWRLQEQQYAQLQQQMHSRKSQAQNLAEMQVRTRQRIDELQQEQSELEHDLLAQQIDSLSQQVAQAKGRYQHAKEVQQKAAMGLQEVEDNSAAHQQNVFEAKGALQNLQAKYAALESLQSIENHEAELEKKLQQLNLSPQPFWRYLKVQSGWERAVQMVSEHWHQVWVVAGSLDSAVDESLGWAKLAFSEAMSSEKHSGTVASVIETEKVPAWLNQIFIVDSLQEAKAKMANLQSHQSVVSKDGHWLGHDWHFCGASAQQSGAIEREAQIRDYALQIERAEQSLQSLSSKADALQQDKQTAQQKLDEVKTDAKQAEQALTQLQNQLNLLQMQHQQSLARQTRISEELSRQQLRLTEEKEQLEALSAEAEELAMQAEERRIELADFDWQREQLQQQLAAIKQQSDHAAQSAHQQALVVQGLRNQLQSLQQAQQRSKQHLLHLEQRQQTLQEEMQTLSVPEHDHEESLSALLEERVVIELTQTELRDQLNGVETILNQTERDQHAVTEKILQLSQATESIKLECEGYRVRARSHQEQLDELKERLDGPLPEIPADSDEHQWQQKLDKVTASLGRLGAVNLAAVEEYEVQAQRKQHLDTQNDDLLAAMDTLEQAIRKIDKETKARFKSTYDRVNNDLKMLFPKVFGGGAAYLELTDDDLLETGVAIMARPPGKKNSTIHLLSGGEKALTALSLVFAIFRLNPAPFCLLDEVDAPLDDANVGRFCKLVSEMSKSVQFIYITHNKIAMEMASHLTGVTMAEPGVSRMVAVDVEEAVAIAQA